MNLLRQRTRTIVALTLAALTLVAAVLLPAVTASDPGPQVTLTSSCASASTADGWCAGDIQVQVTATDATTLDCFLDGVPVACAGFTISVEGLHDVYAEAWDSVGRMDSAEALLGVDRTAPAIGLGILCNSDGDAGWCLGTLSWHGDAQDAGAGVAAVSCTIDGAAAACDGSTSTDSARTLAVTATDRLGHQATASQQLLRDATAPTLSSVRMPAANAWGWSNQLVTVDWPCTDATAGVREVSPTVVFASEGDGQSASGSCVDNAGNRADLVHGDVRIDLTVPVLDPHADVTVPADQTGGANAAYGLATGSDGLSGVRVIACSPASGSFFPLGETTVSCSAEDYAGNAASPVSFVLTVTPAALARIDVAGADSMVAGTSGEFLLAGFDAFDNDAPLAQYAFTFTAPTTVGPTTASYGEQGVTGAKSVEIVADALARIEIDGPTTLVAGTSGTYLLAGFDQYGNSVPLGQTTLDFVAPETVGTATVSYAEQGVAASLDVSIVHDALARIVVDGPLQVVAGTTHAYALAGFDQYGNVVPLAQTSMWWTAPTLVGPATVSYSEAGVTGTLDVAVVHDALARIDVAGHPEPIAGSTTSYAVSGFDQYGNAVPLAVASVAYAVPTAVGPATVSYSEQGVTGTLDVLVVHDALARIDVAGEVAPVAGTTVDYALAGFDQYGNPAPLAQASTSFAVPTAAGPATVAYAEQGVTGALDVTVVHDALDSIAVAGETTVVAGTTHAYALAGFDQYANPVPLAQATLGWTAPTAVGPAEVAYAESGVTGTLGVVVVQDALARIDVTGPSTVIANTTATFAFAGFDQYGNGVPLAETSAEALAPVELGPFDVCTTQEGVTGCMRVESVLGPAVRIDVGAARESINANRSVQFFATAYDAGGNLLPSPTFAWSAENGAIDADGLLVAGPQAGPATVTVRADDAVASHTITVVDTLAVRLAMTRSVYAAQAGMQSDVVGQAAGAYVDGTPTRGVAVTVLIERLTSAGLPLPGTAQSTTLNGAMGPAGTYHFRAPAGFDTVGHYQVTLVASDGANRGTATTSYTVGPAGAPVAGSGFVP